MLGLDEQSAPKQLINEVPSHVLLVNNKVGARPSHSVGVYYIMGAAPLDYILDYSRLDLYEKLTHCNGLIGIRSCRSI